MSIDLRELYQQVILDHQRHPRNFRALAQADRVSRGANPLCGDRVTVYVKLAGAQLSALSFEGVGCAISTASASLMTEHLTGKSLDEAEWLFAAFHALLAENGPQTQDIDSLGKLAVLAGVRRFPARVKCATLPWHTLRAALRGEGRTVSTE